MGRTGTRVEGTIVVVGLPAAERRLEKEVIITRLWKGGKHQGMAIGKQ